MIDINVFSRVVAEIYDAGLGVGRWPTALVSLAEAFDAPKAQISYLLRREDSEPFLICVGMDAAVLARLTADYRARMLVDPRMPPKVFQAYHCRQIVSNETLWASEMYRLCLAPMNVEYALYCLMQLDEGVHVSFSVMRGAEQDPFTEADCEDLNRFIPHVARAAGMHSTLRFARRMAATVTALIDGVPIPMLVLEHDRVVIVNAAAGRMLNGGEILRLDHGRLVGATRAAQAELAGALAETRRGAEEPVCVIFSNDRGRILRAVLRRLDAGSADQLAVAPQSIALYLVEGDRSLELRQDVVQRLFGLTPREADVLCALVDGAGGAPGVALKLGVGVETVKTHLARIMQVVGVGRQSELVRAVLASPAWIAAGRGREPGPAPPRPIT